MNQEELLQRDIAPLIGLDELSEKERQETLARLGELILEGVMLRVLADMNEADAEALEKFAESEPKPEEFTEYLKKAAPDFDRIFSEEVAAFKEETIAVMERSRRDS